MTNWNKFKKKIVEDLIEIYQMNEIDAHRLAHSKEIENLIMEDTAWAQHMGTDYWAEVIVEKAKMAVNDVTATPKELIPSGDFTKEDYLKAMGKVRYIDRSRNLNTTPISSPSKMASRMSNMTQEDWKESMEAIYRSQSEESIRSSYEFIRRSWEREDDY